MMHGTMSLKFNCILQC